MTETWYSSKENTATNAKCAKLDMNQTLLELSVLESSQNVAALKSMMPVVMSAFHAHHMRLPLMETKDVSQDNAQDLMKFSELLINATHADHAKRDQLQTTWEEDA